MSPDKICLAGMVFYGYHGTQPAEKELGQRFIVDLELTADLKPAGLSDDLAQTISYSRVYQAVKRVVEGPSRNLLEAVAEGVAQAVLKECGGEEVRVKVWKPSAPIKGALFSGVAVEITRRREG